MFSPRVLYVCFRKVFNQLSVDNKMVQNAEIKQQSDQLTCRPLDTGKKERIITLCLLTDDLQGILTRLSSVQ